MFSKARDRLRRAVSVRLTAWYCGFFVLSLLALFCIVYLALDSALRKSDQELIREKLKEMASEYKEQGIGEVRKTSAEKRFGGFLVRVADARNRTLFVSAPEEKNITANVIMALENGEAPLEHWGNIPLPRRGEFEVASARLEGGGTLQVGRSSQRRQVVLTHFRRVCVAVVLPMILLAICGGAFLAHRALRPIHQLNETVRGIIETGKIDARISPQKTAGELRELVISFNQMLGKIAALITGMRGVLDNVAHDLRTPITRLRGIAEVALQNPRDSEAAQNALADCVEESERVITMLNTLLDISEVETGAMKLSLKRVDVVEIVRELADVYRDVAEEKNVALVISDAAAPCVVTADENRLRQALGNLLDNAVKYTEPGGEVRVDARRDADQVIISVRDSGIGIPSEEIPHVWERLYRGDKSRSQRGLGLGLSLVKAIVQAHAGECSVESPAGGGSTFTLQLPAAG